MARCRRDGDVPPGPGQRIRPAAPRPRSGGHRRCATHRRTALPSARGDKGGAMKLGQAISSFGGTAAPNELARPVPGRAYRLAGEREALPAAWCHQVAGRRLGPGWGRSSNPSTTGPPPRTRSAKCTGGSGPRATRRSRCQDPVPGRGKGVLGD